MPLKYGGSDTRDNHQLLSAQENLSKGSVIPYTNVADIPYQQLNERWRHILEEAQRIGESIQWFKNEISRAIFEEQKELHAKGDEELTEYFKAYKEANNLGFGVERAVMWHRRYCKEEMHL